MDGEAVVSVSKEGNAALQAMPGRNFTRLPKRDNFPTTSKNLPTRLHTHPYPHRPSSSYSFAMTSFPPELIEKIVNEAWHSEMPSYIRKSFMTTCPSINRTWMAVYAPIASRDIYITNLSYIYYLCDIARLGKSIIYRDFIPQLTRTITCFVDLQVDAMETAVKRVYRCLVYLPNDIGFNALFPSLPYVSFVLRWTIAAQDSQLCDIPIRVRYSRYLSMSTQDRQTQLDLYISLIDMDPSEEINNSTFLPAVESLREIGVPGGLWLFESTVYHHWRILNGVRHFGRTAKVSQVQGDIGGINRRLWMASKGRGKLRYLTTLSNCLEYRRVQRSLPVAPKGTRVRGMTVLGKETSSWSKLFRDRG
ncbi:uncharacterized protein BT62DRAFT_1078443 [Guyanagaster necrorhizus]|uniref:Uncharacterized protein n=1 Tax=Guyanagaster necrorhizus TaxID=856835 RepID=A0A9P8APH9_9AGAR|nr:uncharacterized protein BT62DRAFT_1078443 [Guyanagaster necrorhizus MCA 3950]KAG7443358.1 hypothetical protein BT62DRAFT_1078443 [Guyanagaster necrorhizus MCA 3950]